MMYLDPAEWAQQEILIYGATEPLTLALIRKLATPAACVVDVGAHVGHHALEAARAVGPTGRVLAFDPQPYNADKIGRHAILNDLTNILTLCAAVGDRDDFVRLPMQSYRDRARLSLHEAGPSNENAFVDVPLRRLDTVLDAESINYVSLLKIDVEGYELEVLLGLGTRINDCGSIILELLETTDADRNRAVVDLLLGNGYTLKDVTGKVWKWGAMLPERNLWAQKL
jgi:FkbM family methyltransferase